MIRVVLTNEQMDCAVSWANDRQRSVEQRRGQSQGHSNFPLRQNIIGVMGEIAFASWSRLPWTAIKGFGYDRNDRDVGQYEIRTRRHQSDLDLFVKNSKFMTQKPSTIYVLLWATENQPVVDLVGFTTLGEIAEHGYERWDSCTGYRWTDLQNVEELRVA